MLMYLVLYFQREVKDTPPVVMKGSSGTPLDCTANYIYLNFKENNVFEYEVKYNPDQDYKHLRFKLLNGKFIFINFIFCPCQTEKEIQTLRGYLRDLVYH